MINEIDKTYYDKGFNPIDDPWLYPVSQNVDTVRINYSLSENFKSDPHDINSVYTTIVDQIMYYKE